MRRRRRRARRRMRRRRVALSGESLCPLSAWTPASLGLLGSQSSPRAAPLAAHPLISPATKGDKRWSELRKDNGGGQARYCSSVPPRTPRPPLPIPACFTSAPAFICRPTLTIKVVFLHQRVIKKWQRPPKHSPAGHHSGRHSASPV